MSEAIAGTSRVYSEFVIVRVVRIVRVVLVRVHECEERAERIERSERPERSERSERLSKSGNHRNPTRDWGGANLKTRDFAARNSAVSRIPRRVGAVAALNCAMRSCGGGCVEKNVSTAPGLRFASRCNTSKSSIIPRGSHPAFVMI